MRQSLLPSTFQVYARPSALDDDLAKRSRVFLQALLSPARLAVPNTLDRSLLSHRPSSYCT